MSWRETVGVLVVATATGTATVIGGAAATDAIGPLLALGGAVEVGVAIAGLAVALRRRWPVVAAAGVALFAVSASAFALPLPDQRLPHNGQRWQLDSGSSLRYVHVAARPPARPTPVVFLHGGPGVADLPGDSRYFGQLAADGFDVYVYDQLGAGGSSRLADPRGYTVDRDVLDLEQVRRRIHADRIVLIGHSYGGELAAHYLARYPQHVAKLTLISPGALDPADSSGDRARSGLGWWATAQTYAAVLTPRTLLAYALLQVNPQAAHRYFGDGEADARNDLVLRLSDAARHCPARPSRPPAPGSGFYRLQYPQSATARPAPDIRPAITGNPTPTLVLKGECDYLSWHSALDYTTRLPASRLVYLPGGGHNLYQDRPAATLDTIRAFLLDRPLPVAPHRGEAPPAGYRGGP